MLKEGDNLTVFSVEDDFYILTDDCGGHHTLNRTNPKPNMATELSNVIHDIGAEEDDYAKTVLPLLERILADDYTGTGLFEAIDRHLKLVEPAIDPDSPE